MKNYFEKLSNRRIKMKKIDKLQHKAELAMKEAIREVVEKHKKSGRPLVVWENGKTVRVSANKFSGKQ